MVLQAIVYKRGSLKILDQLELPHREVYVPITGVDDAWQAIKSMRVRGAPAIAIVAALGLAVELNVAANTLNHVTQASSQEPKVVEDSIILRLDYLITSRPTAVNLADAASKLKKVIRSAVIRPQATELSVYESFIKAAEQMLVDDLRDNENIGRHGADWILGRVQDGEKIGVLTHCNTGYVVVLPERVPKAEGSDFRSTCRSLATAGYGTALGIVRNLHARQILKHAYYTETRPYNQGSRLTGFELIHDDIPATLITDSMAAALLRLRRHSENIVAVVVGADRVSANGDTANKIGTYSLAILARHHNVKFLVAAPRTTIDINTKSGDEIIVEERDPMEMTVMKGPCIRQVGKEKHSVNAEHVEVVSIAAKGTQVWNPAFDITPAELIDGIITEVGVVEKGEDGKFNLDHIFTKQESNSDFSGAKKPMPSPIEGP